MPKGLRRAFDLWESGFLQRGLLKGFRFLHRLVLRGAVWFGILCQSLCKKPHYKCYILHLRRPCYSRYKRKHKPYPMICLPTPATHPPSH